MREKDTRPYNEDFWVKNKINLVQTQIEQIDFKNKSLIAKDNIIFTYDKLVLATGSIPNMFNWPGQDLNGVSGFYHLKDLKFLEDQTPNIQEACIIGGGLIGVELAEMLISRGIKVHFIVRENSFWSNVISETEGRLLEKHILAHKVELYLNAELDKINGDEMGNVQSITLKNGKEITCQYVGITTGVKPNIEFLKSTELDTKRGVLVNKYLETSVSDVYAIGDCAEISEPVVGRKSIEAVWYTGKMMGETLAKTLSGNKTAYNPGNWFNSAKFFDIEYQTYGNIPAVYDEFQSEMIWQDGNKSLRIVYEKETKQFLGINTFGIRLRHAFFEQKLNSKSSILSVIEDLQKADFDPEFTENYLKQAINQFNTILNT